MKKLIIGKNGTGKTTFIAKEIIPTIEKYLVLDFCHEYSQWIKDETKIRKFERGLVGNKLKQQVIDVIRNVKDDMALIIDNAQLLYFPKAMELHPQVSYKKGDGGFLWLREELIGKNYVLVFQSIESIIQGEVPDIFDDIYCFPTKDNDGLEQVYLDWQIEQGKNVIIKNGFSYSTL